MGMPNEEQHETEIVDTKDKLPFVLKLIIGTEGKGDFVFLNRLCKHTTTIAHCVYKVQELKALRLMLHCQKPLRVTFIWNKVYEGQKDKKEWQYELHRKKTKSIVI